MQTATPTTTTSTTTPTTKTKSKPREKSARVVGLKQLMQKKFTFIGSLPERILASFGWLPFNFWMIIWGESGNGKTNLLTDILKAVMPFGKVLYVALEEGTEVSTVMRVKKSLNEEEHSGKIEFADHTMTIEELKKKLRKKKQPKFIVIDSVQYWFITLKDYWDLKKEFGRKYCFIFISHAKGKQPDGKLAEKIRYDVPIKVYVSWFIAFVQSRFGGNNPYVIWEEGARRHYGKQFSGIAARKFPVPTREDIEPLMRKPEATEQEQIETQSEAA
jgi:hypothetical protein